MPTPRRRSFTVKIKLQAVEWLRNNNSSYEQAAMEFCVAKKQIWHWDKNYANLVAMNKGKTSRKRKLHPGPKGASSVDDELLNYLVEK